MLLADAQSVTLVQQLGTILQDAFGGDVPIEPLTLYQVAARAAAVYLLGLAIVRIGKSRLISRTTSLDVILGFILGSLLSRGITGHASISGTLLASAVIVAVHWVLTAIACRSHGFGNVFKGNTELLVENGRVLRKAMLHSHLSDHDLIEQLPCAASITCTKCGPPSKSATAKSACLLRRNRRRSSTWRCRTACRRCGSRCSNGQPAHRIHSLITLNGIFACAVLLPCVSSTVNCSV